MQEKLVNAALSIATIIFCLVVLEVSLRAYHGGWDNRNFRFPQPNKFGYHTYDPELGWVPKSSNQWRTSIAVLKEGGRSNGGGEDWAGTGDPILPGGGCCAVGDQGQR